MSFPKLAALGAVAVSFGALGIWLLLAFIARPTDTGGMDTTQWVLTSLSSGIVILALVAVHLVFAKMLLDESRRAPRP